MHRLLIIECTNYRLQHAQINIQIMNCKMYRLLITECLNIDYGSHKLQIVECTECTDYRL